MVTFSAGASYFCTEASDSPSFSRIFVAASPSAFSTCSLPLAVACSFASTSPLRQFTAFSPTTYWLPRLEIEPSMVAALAVRWQTSWANSRVSLASLGCAIRASVCATRSSESKFRNGDCSSCADSPCRSVPSKTGSPVVLVKSARTMVSLSVSAWTLRECSNQAARGESRWSGLLRQ